MYSFVDAFPIGKGVLPLDVTCDVFPAETFKATKFQQWEIFVSSCVSIFSLPEEHDAFQVELLHFLNCPLKPTCFGQSACLLLLTFLGLKKALIEVKASVVCFGEIFAWNPKCFRQATKTRKYPKWGGTEWHDHEFLYPNLIRRTYDIHLTTKQTYCTPLQL